MSWFSERAHGEAVSAIVSILRIDVTIVEVQVVRVVRRVRGTTPVVPVPPTIVRRTTAATSTQLFNRQVWFLNQKEKDLPIPIQ